MKKIILLTILVLTSCSAPKKIKTSENKLPKNFDEAEKWFDEWHKR